MNCSDDHDTMIGGKRGSEISFAPLRLCERCSDDEGHKERFILCVPKTFFWLCADPFQPFRILLNSGRSYDIRHPEMLKVGRTTINIISYRGEQTDIAEHAEMIGLVLVERIEPLPSPSHA